MNAITIKNLGDVKLELFPEALDLKTKVISKSRRISSVSSAPAKEIALEVFRELKELSNEMEASRKEVKRPVDAIAKQIQKIASDFSYEIETEKDRIGALIGGYEAEERKAIAEAEAQRVESLKAESEKLKNGTEEEQRLAEEAIRESQPIKVEASKGARFMKSYKWEVIDLAEAFKARPDLFRIEPVASLCNAASQSALTNNAQIPGFRLWVEEKMV